MSEANELEDSIRRAYERIKGMTEDEIRAALDACPRNGNLRRAILCLIKEGVREGFIADARPAERTR